MSGWLVNTTGATGYNSIPSNVQRVQYSAGNVYITCTGGPAYGIGPWPGNPNVATNQNFVFKITRTPQASTGAATATPLGHTGLWSNGVSIFNARDAMSYLNQGVWNQNAIVAGRGNLDEHNGRYGITPEYPGGTYAYFVIINGQYAGAYPYTPGPTYYGVVPAGATGPQSGHAGVNEPVTTYVVKATFLAAGVYCLRVEGAGVSATKKVIVAH